MQYLRYNTDSQEVVFGIFVDSTDGNTEETGLTIANTDIKIWKTGATTLANKNSGGATHISNGIYYAVFDATDTNTLGSGKAFIHVSGALYTVIEFCVLPQKVYDSMILGSDNLEVDTIQIEGVDATNQLNSATPSVTVSDKTGFSLSVTPPTAAEIRTEIDSNSTQLSAVKTVTDKINTAMSLDGAVYQFTANALELAPSGGSGGDATLEKQGEILTAISGIITHGDSNWLTPSGIGGTIAVTFNIKDDSGNNILDAVVEIWDTEGTTLKERKDTDSSGNAVFNCKAESYIIKITKSGYSCDNQTYTVSSPATVNYVMTALSIAPPADPSLCRVWIKVVNPGSIAHSSLTAKAIVDNDIISNDLVSGEIQGVYDSLNKIVYWDIARGINATVYINELPYSANILVPDSSMAELESAIV